MLRSRKPNLLKIKSPERHFPDTHFPESRATPTCFSRMHFSRFHGENSHDPDADDLNKDEVALPIVYALLSPKETVEYVSVLCAVTSAAIAIINSCNEV